MGSRRWLFGKAGERQWEAVYRAGRAPSPGVRIGRRTTYDPRSDFSTEGSGCSGKKGNGSGRQFTGPAAHLHRESGSDVGLRSGPRSDFSTEGSCCRKRRGGAAVGGRSGARTRRRTRIRYEFGLLDRGVGLSEKKGGTAVGGRSAGRTRAAAGSPDPTSYYLRPEVGLRD